MKWMRFVLWAGVWLAFGMLLAAAVGDICGLAEPIR